MLADKAAIEANAARSAASMNAGKNALAKTRLRVTSVWWERLMVMKKAIDRVLLKTRGAKLTDKADQQNGIGHFLIQTNCKVLWGGAQRAKMG